MESLYNLETIIKDRKENYLNGSYTCYLFEQGLDKILKKCGEECSEMIVSSKNDDRSKTVEEISDLLYHVIVLAVELGIPLLNIEKELALRAEKQLNLKPIKNTDHNS